MRRTWLDKNLNALLKENPRFRKAYQAANKLVGDLALFAAEGEDSPLKEEYPDSMMGLHFTMRGVYGKRMLAVVRSTTRMTINAWFNRVPNLVLEMKFYQRDGKEPFATLDIHYRHDGEIELFMPLGYLDPREDMAR